MQIAILIGVILCFLGIVALLSLSAGHYKCLRNYCKVGDYYNNLMNAFENVTGPVPNGIPAAPVRPLPPFPPKKTSLKQRECRWKKVGEVQY